MCASMSVPTSVFYALQFSRWSAPSGCVVAFEPNPEAVAVLLRHLGINGLSDRVTVEPLAVGDQNREATLYVAGTDGMTRLGEPDDQIADRTAASAVKETTLDEFSRQSGLLPNWLIVDIEGHEFAALCGGSQLIKSQQGKLGIVVEMHPSVWAASGNSRYSAEALLHELGLHAFPLTGQTDPPGEYGIVHLAFD